jgi:hypothetical protein
MGEDLISDQNRKFIPDGKAKPEKLQSEDA